ncbi:MAG TPA: hypothetical protein VNA27_05395 [Rubrobacteraceae bacterium]|nr:hypothetical protein [Rubrobacteraceae bacterium]
MNREEATEQILEAKKEQDITFEAIAQRVTIKALINEEFGAGNMSATTFNLDIKRVESDEGPESGSPTTASSSHTPGAEVSEAACTQLSPRDERLSHRFMPHRIVLW